LALLVAGLAFATDLALWHRSIHLTSVANATLLSNLSPVFLALSLHFGLGEKQRPRFWLGLALALAGAGWLVADSLRIGVETAFGDLLAATTAIFYAIYQYLVSRARRAVSTFDVMLWAAIAGAPWLLAITLASGETLMPAGARGWALLAALALVVHVCGQGLIAWAQAGLPVAFTSVALLVQPAAAALFAVIILSEPFGARQALGAAVILAGIVICRVSPPPAQAEGGASTPRRI
jgi:drug/metabolite transporter (DMT)-like permease